MNTERMHPYAESTTEKQCFALADTVVSSLFATLIGEASKRDNVLTESDLRKLEQIFKTKCGPLSGLFHQAMEQIPTATTGTQRQDPRRHPFYALLSKRFQHLFKMTEPGRPHTTILAPTMYPGFYVVLDMMIGHNNIKEFEAVLLEKMKDPGKPASLDELDSLDEVHDRILNVQYCILKYFDERQKRLEWMCALINANLAENDALASGQHGWMLTRKSCHAFVLALTSDLRAMLDEDKTALVRFLVRHPETSRDALKAELLALEHLT